jgi:hypothetical protein
VPRVFITDQLKRNGADVAERWPAAAVGDLPQHAPHVDALHMGWGLAVECRGEVPPRAAELHVVLDGAPAPQPRHREKVLPRARCQILVGLCHRRISPRVVLLSVDRAGYDPGADGVDAAPHAGLAAANAGKFTVMTLTENYSFVPDQAAVQQPCDIKGLLGRFAEGFWPGKPGP